jgi:dienelactone hydrolase
MAWLKRAAAALALMLAGIAPALSAVDAIDTSLREEVHRLPVSGTDAQIVMTGYRPSGSGPFPWIVLSHGTAPSADKNRTIGRYRNPQLVHEWVRRGYAVLVPVRRGYGDSGGQHLGDGYGTCERPDFRAAGENAAKDILAAVEWARTQRDLDPARWMLVGQSSGGFSSIYVASKRPPGLMAVLAFSPGRGGDPDKRRGAPCASGKLADLFASVAPKVSVPVLWFYAENDQYIGPQTQRLWFDAFQAAGGHGQLVVVPPFPERQGHGVFPSPRGTPLWTSAVERFIDTQHVPLRF